ncbi:MAG: Mannose-phosphate guanylyltransferase [Bacteroidota bacterium]|jgi:mannose-6-phosphate isomerase-like protein (cupin superfamily)
MEKHKVLEQIEKWIADQGFTVVAKDFERPWGGFFVLEEAEAAKFAATFFPELSFEVIQITQKLSPKFLVVAPQQRLSWQYHFRRAEIWKVVNGPVAVAISSSDEQHKPNTYQDGDFIKLDVGQRHRLIGLDNFGLVAEIWQHTDMQNPSDEEDIIRLQDDFGR